MTQNVTFEEWCETTTTENKWFATYRTRVTNSMKDKHLGKETYFTFPKFGKISGIFSYGDKDGLVWNDLSGGNGLPNYASEEEAFKAYNER